MELLEASISPATVVGALIACVSCVALDLMSTTLTGAVSHASSHNHHLQPILQPFEQISR